MDILRRLVNEVTYKIVGQSGFDRANDSMDKMEDSAEAAGEALTELELRQTKAYRAGELLGRSIRRVGGGLLTLTRRAGRAVLALGGVGGVGFAGLGIAALKFAGDAEEVADKMRFALGDATTSAERWVRDTGKAFGLQRTQLRQFVTDFSLQLQTATDQATATDLAQQLTARAFDIQSFFNVKDIDEVFNSLRSGLNGSSEPLEKFNVNIKEGALQNFILASGMAKSKKEITESTKKLARLQLILKQTEVAQGNLGDTQDTFTGQLRKFRSEFIQILTDIGIKFLPTATRVLTALNKSFSDNKDEILGFFESISVKVEGFIANDGLQKIADGFGDIAEFAGDAFREADKLFGLTSRNREINDEFKRIEQERILSSDTSVGRIGAVFRSVANRSETRAIAARNVDSRGPNFVPFVVPFQSIPSPRGGQTVTQTATVTINGADVTNTDGIRQAVRNGVADGFRHGASGVTDSGGGNNL